MSYSASTIGLPVLRHSSSASAGRFWRIFVGEPEQDASALLRRGGCPRAVFESGFGGGDGAVHVVGGGVGNLRDDFFGRGIVDREGLRRLAGDPFAVDEHLVGLYVGLHSAGHRGLLQGLKPRSFMRLKRRG